jgi:hypothetical protein
VVVRWDGEAAEALPWSHAVDGRGWKGQVVEARLGGGEWQRDESDSEMTITDHMAATRAGSCAPVIVQ